MNFKSMVKRLGEFFQDARGANSSARLLAIVSVFLVLGVWAYLSIRLMVIQPIPEMVVILVLGIVGGKVWQKYAEKPTTGTSEIITETKTTAVTPATETHDTHVA